MYEESPGEFPFLPDRSQAIPMKWVGKIFEILGHRYGQQFLRRWDGLEMMKVHLEWAVELGRFRSRPDCIQYALEHLPADKPPTLGEFRALCNSAPEPNTPRLEAPKGKPPAEVVQAIKAIGSPSDPKAWAYRLKARDEAGDVIPSYSRRCYREALGCCEPALRLRQMHRQRQRRIRLCHLPASAGLREIQGLARWRHGA